MNNDLISRSELKKAIDTYDKFACLPDNKLSPFRDLKYPEMYAPYIHFEDVINAINNAPKVNIEGVFDCGYYFGNKSVKDERPQGEWITQEGYDGDEYYECSICKDAFTLMYGTPKDNNYNFCPNCGADMRGEEK